MVVAFERVKSRDSLHVNGSVLPHLSPSRLLSLLSILPTPRISGSEFVPSAKHICQLRHGLI
jgi:hypothetical protein